MLIFRVIRVSYVNREASTSTPSVKVRIAVGLVVFMFEQVSPASTKNVQEKIVQYVVKIKMYNNTW